MSNVPQGAPLAEQGGRLRGMMDFVAGHYPKFLFGLGVGKLLPVFHFHQATVETLEPAFRYLAENHYRTVGLDDMTRLVRHGHHPGPRTVMLAFDDAWASLWLVVAPLLERYDLRAVTYAIPGRIRDAAAVRPTIAEGPVDATAADRAHNPFATWPELRALSAGGRVEVQSHTWSHSMVFTGPEVIGVVDHAFGREPQIVHPRLNAGRIAEYLGPSRMGSPLFARRSRMSDGRRFWPDADACAHIASRIQALGGHTFLERADWRSELSPLLESVPGRWETDADRISEIETELILATEAIEHQIRMPVRHICLPWGVSGSTTRAALERVGMLTAFANRLSGRLAVAAGDDPFFLKRLDNRYIFALPGTGRRIFAMRA